jgi:hypothetical protein
VRAASSEGRVTVNFGDPAQQCLSRAQDDHGSKVMDHPALGRLLIFDPTVTLVGDLPNHEQASLALVLAGVNGNERFNPSQSGRINRARTPAGPTFQSEVSGHRRVGALLHFSKMILPEPTSHWLLARHDHPLFK